MGKFIIASIIISSIISYIKDETATDYLVRLFVVGVMMSIFYIILY